MWRAPRRSRPQSCMVRRPDHVPPGIEQLSDLEFTRRVAIIHKETRNHMDLVDAMNRIARNVSNLNEQYRELMAYGYKALNSRSAVAGVNDQQADAIREEHQRVDLDFRRTCQDVISLVDECLLPAASTYESYAFYKNMRAEYTAFVQIGVEEAAVMEQSGSLGTYQNCYELERSLMLRLRNTLGLSLDHALKLMAFWRVLRQMIPDFSVNNLLFEEEEVLRRVCSDSCRCAEVIMNPYVAQRLGNHAQDQFWESLTLQLISRHELNNDLFVAYAQALDKMYKELGLPDTDAPATPPEAEELTQEAWECS